MGDVINGSERVHGRVRIYRMPDDVVSGGYVFQPHRNTVEPQCVRANGQLWIPQRLTDWSKNDVLYDWASIASRMLAEGSTNYRIAGMYLEFKNVADPDDAVAAPAFTRAGGIGYYNGLASSPNVDYLRVPLISAVRSSSDADLFPDGNVMTYFAQSQGVVGVHGKTFSDSVNSKIYGGALVAIPEKADRTRDLVFSRFYFDADEQQVKLPTSNLGLEWEITLE
jgi:hypothetical protein